jgi:NAD(P)-dependent dehydrogenase (short-subunit alcohol dehydrogenase family)
LAAAGSNIFFTSWQPYDASMAEPEFPGRFVQELQQQRVDAAWLELDLADPIGPKQLIAIVKRRFGTAHNLINNACY